MKVLVATREGQGAMEGDYCFTVDGELVTPAMLECCRGDECGCRRGFAGLASERATTTAEVVDLPEMTVEQLRQALVDSLTRGGWLGILDEESDRAMVDEHLEEIERAAQAFEVGTVLGRRGGQLWDRAYPGALVLLEQLERLTRFK